MAQPVDVQRLLRVCEQGDEAGLQLLLDSGWKVNVQDENGVTPLQVAAANNHFLLVSFLLYNGSDIDASNSTGWSAIHHACFHGHNETIKVLLKSKASKSLRNKYGATPLSVAVASGHNSTVKLLLDAGCKADEGQVALPVLSASAYGYPSILRQLLSTQKESNIKKMVNSVDKVLGWSPILMAAALDSKPIVQYLLERGANPDYQNRHYLSALDIATVLNHTEVMAYLRGKTTVPGNKSISGRGTESDLDELLSACKSGDYLTVETLLETRLGLDVNGTDSLGASPLLYASLRGHVEIISKLFNKGAKLDFQDAANGWTALMQAVFYGHRDAVRQLLKFGADPTIPAHNGITAFDLATLIEENDTELIKMLALETMDRASIRHHKNDMKDEKGLKAWWAKVGKKLHMFPHSDLTENSNDHKPPKHQDFDFLTQPIGIRQRKAFQGAGCKSATLSIPPHLRMDKIVSDNIPEGVTSDDIGKFLPLINTTMLLRKPPHEAQNQRGAPIEDKAGPGSNKLTKFKNKSNSKNSLRPTSFSDFRPRTKSPPREKRKVQKVSKDQPKDVNQILKQLSMEKYSHIFLTHEIDLAAFVELTDSDLQEMGITKPQPRKQILEKIRKLKSKKFM